MMNRSTFKKTTLIGMVATLGLVLATGCSSKKDESSEKANPCGPAAANPCGPAANPCGPAANPCGPAANPCGPAAKVDPALIKQPDGFAPNTGDLDNAKLLAMGAALWSDPKLSGAGITCNTCHSSPAMYKDSFAKPYPHPVTMASERAGLESVTGAEMVQLCMKIPMASDPLPWDSVELAALVAVVQQKNAEFIAMAPEQRKGAGGAAMQNPCGGEVVKNPCAGTAVKNPCAGAAAKKKKNPCASPTKKKKKNPCAGPTKKKKKNPCAGPTKKNPCAAAAVKNPCGANPCGG